jgi:flagellar hook-basal body complex protein FliE
LKIALQESERIMVDELNPMDVGPLTPGLLRPKSETVAPKTSFEQVFKDFVTDVNTLQKKAGRAIDQMASGEVRDIHQVMTAVEEAGIALDLMLEIRNRVLEGYQEIMRMQV